MASFGVMNLWTLRQASRAQLLSSQARYLLPLTQSTAALSNSTRRDGLVSKYLGPQAGVSDPASHPNRWSMFVPAFLTHACIGAPYGWSALTSALTREQGVVAAAASDWSLDLCTYPMTILIGGGGLFAAMLGKWSAKVGPRRAMVQGCLTAGIGYGLAATSIVTHNIYLFYPSIALIAFGNGSVYTPPVQVMLDWFPDRKGLASGIVIGGFGSGALFFAPTMNKLMDLYSKAPDFLGKQLDILTEGGRQFAQIGGDLTEVVYASTADLAKLPFQGLAEGYYAVGTGSTGVGLAYGTLGAIYTSLILASSLGLRRAPLDFKPAGWNPVSTDGSGVMPSVHVDIVPKTPQFWLLFSTSALLCTGGMGIMSVAKPMITEVFSTAMPTVVTASFATAYLMAMAGGNLGGRVGWAAISDKIGRRATFGIFTTGGIATYASLPMIIEAVVADPNSSTSKLLLSLFCFNTMVGVTIMGGVFAVLPAYEADLFGAKYVGPIHSRFLLAATLSSLAGPALLLNLRSAAENKAIDSLMKTINPLTFEKQFNAPVDQLQDLVQAKTVTMSRLMEITPTGTIDPSPYIYNTTLYTMAGLVSAAAALHYMVKPVNSKYFDQTKLLEQKEKFT